MFKRPVSIVFIIYVIIGIVVAWTRGYITIGLIKGILSALLAIFLWFLPCSGSASTCTRACPVGLGRRERPSGGMGRKAEEELIAELSAATATPRNALRGTRSRLKTYGTRPRASGSSWAGKS